MSDVPLGVFLSGGLDSSAIAGLMAPMMGRPLETFSVAFADRAYLEESVAAANASKVLIYERCDAVGLRYWRSEGNFVLIRVDRDASGQPRSTTAASLVEAMAARGILIRDRSTQPGCEGCVRVTAGVVDATRRCLDVMEELLAPRPR